MSLFGGDGSGSTTESEYDSEDVVQTPPVVASPRSAQHLQTLDDAEAADLNDILSTESDADTADEDSERPNQFTGKKQLWRGYTAVERQIAASLDQMRNSDLSAHLFNSHALRRRVRKPAEELAQLPEWQSRDFWLKAGKDLQYTDAAGVIQTALVPPKSWTAWPLPPSSLPSANKASQTYKHHAYPGTWTIEGSGAQSLGEDLREEVLAVFLRLAKQKWHARDAEEDASRGRGSRHLSRSRSRSKSMHSADSHMYTTDTEATEDDESGVVTDDSDVTKQINREPKKGVTRKEVDTNLEPTILADDDKAKRLLQPSINSMLSKLDELALGVRRARLNHFGRGDLSDVSSLSEFTSDVESTKSGIGSSSKAAVSRPVSRQRRKNQSRRPSVSGVDGSRQNNGEGFDTEDEAVSSSSSNADPSPRHVKSKRARSGSSQSCNSSSTIHTRHREPGLMDWSEVLGIAAVQGWDRKALARTIERCTALFGESMSLRALDEHQLLKPAPAPALYTPTPIPSPSDFTLKKHPSTKRPYFQIGTVRCPHVDCYGHTRDFALPYRTIEHCIRVHGYDPRENDSDNEERTVGAVHIDGFLQPVTLKQGWLGHKRKKAGGASKRQKQSQSHDEEEAEPIASVE
ncbi:N-terminal acetyltransferase [Coniothyrium glycines]